MNPYTMLRHILYSYNSEKYKSLLTPFQMQNLEKYKSGQHI